ncbi:MAG: hypothetical protein A2428_10225 [Bdellovibrionales bacterium RIFOXYC1_FULL_54_43]|nr:MAG: hypothetical protein A2428_10225 [Bdellovibrionales bacterium RIFOXYC1_FULL_54_43]OFZ80505.1 MAG: hypothetical protein A2603_13030 [Bdellovibrionales bacterium RIFOXYD1_FULL_55_31]
MKRSHAIFAVSVFLAIAAGAGISADAVAHGMWSGFSGNPERGKEAIKRYGCGSCHVVPGIRDAHGRVGPKLEDFGEQIYVAGVLPNTPDNVVRWIMNPRDHSPRTAMPDLGVSKEDASDMAAYLLEK